MAGACTNSVDTGFVALGYGKVAVLGVVQGITELLPISSTAHMRIVPSLLGWQDPGSPFSAVMQLAALAAVVSYFWKDVRWLAFGSLSAISRRDYSDRALRFSLGIIVATIPISVCGLLLAKMLNTCGSPLRSLWVIGASCIFMAGLLAIAELRAKLDRTTDRVSIMDFIWVGLAQVGALIPGISRSGSTMTAGLFLGFKREEAARFSFLIGLPAITLAGLKELWVLYHANLDMNGWLILSFGLVVASVSAFFAIWGLFHLLEKFSSWPFVIYRGLLGIFLILSVSLGWLT